MLHRRYFSLCLGLCDISKPDIEAFIEQANLHHPTIKFTAETYDTETVFLDTVVYKAQDSRKTPRKPPLRKIIQISKNAWWTEATHKLW